jgi:pimeloyl-ACP methyl ester carboxylesterase
LNFREPISHFFYSDRLKLQFWDYGQNGNPEVLLVHGGLDHARSWDWVARSLCADYHVYAVDLRGHGNSAWAPGAIYSMAEFVLDLAVLADIISKEPIRIIGHSLGGMIVMHYAGLYPERVHKAISIEGLGFPEGHKIHGALSEHMRRWIGAVRGMEKRTARSYADLESAVARMKEANPRLSDEVAAHLTLHGTNWNADGSITWKFDNYMHAVSPYGHNLIDTAEVFSHISSPVMLFWGTESFMPMPDTDPRRLAIPNCEMVIVENAGHWLHHDQLDLFLRETKRFLK